MTYTHIRETERYKEEYQPFPSYKGPPKPFVPVCSTCSLYFSSTWRRGAGSQSIDLKFEIFRIADKKNVRSRKTSTTAVIASVHPAVQSGKPSSRRPQIRIAREEVQTARGLPPVPRDGSLPPEGFRAYIFSDRSSQNLQQNFSSFCFSHFSEIQQSYAILA